MIHPTATVSEQVNRKYPLGSQFYNFRPPIPSNYSRTIDVGALWQINLNHNANT